MPQKIIPPKTTITSSTAIIMPRVCLRERFLPLPLGFMAVPLLGLAAAESGTVSCEGRANSVGGTAASFIGAANTVGRKDIWLGGVTGSVGAMISSVGANAVSFSL